MFDKLLIANRGEIARRVIRTARALGYRTVAVYSEADALSPHVREADEAICIGPAASSESYLNVDRILDACKRTGATAVHPGYGFLSENADFARALEQAGLVFVGPPASAIDAMGSKMEAKRRMVEAGVPCVPGYHGEDQSDEALSTAAASIGYPLMVKASAGGGGRGMRLVHEESALMDAIASARSEAVSAFGSGKLLLERAVMQARHVEIQVFADTHGNAIHLGERDCSIQRRHQKVVEEAPSPAVTPEIREQMGAAATAAARAIGYVGAGTVEFLLDASGEFYFLEMNTRLQVEHPVTECITGFDLVAWQLDVASGAPLPVTQAEVVLEGHAIEARLYAEDPAGGFLPQTGDVLRWTPATGEGVRVDDGLESGMSITPHYDPMIAKIIAYGANREVARRRLIRALEDTVILGATTNRKFLVDCLRHAAFASGDATTGFIASAFEGGPEAPTPTSASVALCGVLMARLRGSAEAGVTKMWSSTGRAESLLRLEFGSELYDVRVSRCGEDHYEVEVENHGQHAVRLLSFDLFDVPGKTGARVEVDGLQRDVDVLLDGATLYVREGANDWVTEDALRRPRRVEPGADGRILAPMTGKILQVEVALGDRVEPGQRLGVLEAMKMEHNLTTPVAGEVMEVGCKTGEQVSAKVLLFRIEPDAAE